MREGSPILSHLFDGTSQRDNTIAIVQRGVAPQTLLRASRQDQQYRQSVLIGCCCATPDRQGNVFLSFKLGGINRLGIQVKGRRHLRVGQQPLNRLYVLAPTNQKRRKPMTRVMEPESLIWKPSAIPFAGLRASESARAHHFIAMDLTASSLRYSRHYVMLSLPLKPSRWWPAGQELPLPFCSPREPRSKHILLIEI